MTIEKLPSGNYRIKKMIQGKTYRATLDHKPSKTEAESVIEELAREQVTAADKDMSFKAAAEGYLKLKSNVLSPTTTRAYKCYLRNMSDNFTRIKINRMDQLIIQKYINDISPDYAPKSVRNIHGFISAVLAIYRPNLNLHTTLPQKIKYEAHTPSNFNVEQIIEVNKGTRYEIPFRLACYGLRKSEICALTSADLDGNHLMINKAYVYTGTEWILRHYNKTYGSQRDIYIDDELADLIAGIDGKLFKGNPDTLYKRLMKLLKENDIEHFRLHDFRAFFASYAHALGIPDAYIMDQGGWSSPHVMQQIYRRTLKEQRDEAMVLYSKNLPK